MSEAKEIKPCPRCGATSVRRGAAYPRTYDDTEWTQCLECRFGTHFYLWNALPRREEIHRELMTLEEKVRGHAVMNVDYMDHGKGIRQYRVADAIKEIAEKYAPAEPDKEDG